MKNTNCSDRQKVLLLFLLAALLANSGFSSCSTATPSISNMIKGQLVDQNGRPVSQYAVKCEGVDQNGGWSGIAFTDFSGSFQFLNVPPGRYKVLPLNQVSDQSQVFQVRNNTQDIGTIKLNREIKVELNKDAARVISEETAKAINPDAAKTLNPEAAKTINVEAAKMINPQAAQTINWQAAQTINPEAAKTINPEAAKTINPAAARVLNADRARFLTKEEALTISVEKAKQPPPIG